MLTELDAAFNIDEMCDTEHLSPQPGTAWKFEHKPVTSSPVVSFTNITIAETPTLNQPRLKRGMTDFNTKCNLSFIKLKTNLSKCALIKHGLFQLALIIKLNQELFRTCTPPTEFTTECKPVLHVCSARLNTYKFY